MLVVAASLKLQKNFRLKMNWFYVWKKASEHRVILTTTATTESLEFLRIFNFDHFEFIVKYRLRSLSFVKLHGT